MPSLLGGGRDPCDLRPPPLRVGRSTARYDATPGIAVKRRGRISAQNGSPPQGRKSAERLRERRNIRRALSGQIISLAQLVGRPIRDAEGVRVGRVRDVVVRWDSGATHPPVVGILVSVGKAITFLESRDLVLGQTGVRLRSAKLVVGSSVRREGDVVLARDVLDRQLVDVAGVQVVRASDVYLVHGVEGWEVAGIDVGLWALCRRILPGRRSSPTPDRSIDWADLQAFVPPFNDAGIIDASNPAASAGKAGSSVQLASRAADLHKLRAKDVAALLENLNRTQQAQLAALADPSTVAEVLRELDPAKLRALLGELDDADRSRLLALLPQENSS